MRNETELESIGTTELSAWSVSETHCRIQTTSPHLVKTLKRLPDSELVAWSVAGHFLRIYSIRRTLPWVRREVVEKHGLFLNNGGGCSGKNALPSDLANGRGPTLHTADWRTVKR